MLTSVLRCLSRLDMQLFERSYWSLFLFAALFPLVGACGASKPAHESTAGLPTYNVEQAALFDDSFAPQIWSGVQEYDPAREDPRFEDRARLADAVLVAKIVTVSREGSAVEGSTYSVTLQPVNLLIGKSGGGPIIGQVPRTSPTFWQLENASSGFVGKAVILLVRRYSEQDKVVIHWRAEPSAEAVRTTIMRARQLR